MWNYRKRITQYNLVDLTYTISEMFALKDHTESDMLYSSVD